jgi:hypothetical protein
MKNLRLTESQYAERTKKASKYRNVKTDGFASKREAARYQELLLLEKAGEIKRLDTQVKYPLVVNGQLICTYIADFVYKDLAVPSFCEDVVEDCKGFRTPTYKLKKKLMEAIHHIVIKET